MFERMNSLNPPSLRSLKQPVVWNEDVYALGRDSKGDGNLYKYSLSSNEWSNFSVPSSIYASNSVLTSYCSMLLLINGESMALWEFSNKDIAFKESCIKPIPSTYLSQCSDDHNILATSSDKYLIVACKTDRRDRRLFLQLIYNGRYWKFGQPEAISKLLPSGEYIGLAAIDSRAIFATKFRRNHFSILRAPIPSFDEGKDEEMAETYWEKLEIMSIKEFDALLGIIRRSSIVRSGKNKNE
jgi:hypothetical protein